MSNEFTKARATSIVGASIIISFVLLGRSEGAQPGNPFSNTQPRPADGKVVLHNLGPNTPRTTVDLTDAAGAKIGNGIGWPRNADWKVDPDLPTTGNLLFWKASITIPAKVQKQGTDGPGKTPEFIDVDDYHHSGTDSNGLKFTMNVESLFQDPSTGQFVVGNVFGSLASQVGFGQVVSLPLFGADTNLDGQVGAGDTLFELMDLNVDLSGFPSFSLGDALVASGGQVGGFNGLQLSSTPFVFDSLLGFVGTPYSGPVEIIGSMDLSAVPEPATSLLLLCGCVGAAACRRRRGHARGVR